MKILSAEFIRGVIGDTYDMEDGLPHVAFFGRSNAGKSSVINCLVERKQLARSSVTPGKTREANFYGINKAFYFVDFPGYGYAKISKVERDKLAKRILWYVQFSPIKPKLMVLIMDSKVGFTDHDREMLRIMHESGHTVLIIANKIDKLKKNDILKRATQLRNEVAELGYDNTSLIPFSAVKKRGKENVWEVIEQVLA